MIWPKLTTCFAFMPRINPYKPLPLSSTNIMIKSITRAFLLLLLIGVVSKSIHAQAPDKMSYQAVIRNSSNVLIQNHAVGVRISILQGSTSGSIVYSETQTTNTNANGLMTLQIIFIMNIKLLTFSSHYCL